MPEKVQETYNSVIAVLQLHQLTCSCGCSSCLSVHAYYCRSLKTPAGPVRMRILRVICSECKKTHALLPSFLVPYSQIPAPLQAEIACQADGPRDFSSFLEQYPCMDENCIRSILRSYLLHWKERLLSHAVSLSPFASLVAACFLHHRRQFMQIKKTVNVLFLKTT